jgi:PAS domain S-box-containing protein
MFIENLQTLKFDMAEVVRVEAERKRLNVRNRHYRVNGLMRYITVIFMAICLLSVCAAGAQPERTHKVLVLNSYHRGYYWSDYIMAAIQSEFDKTELKVELFFEYMDAKRYQNEEIFPYLKELYGLKYKGIQLDLIISSDNEALVFLLAYRDLLFPGVPVVFCGVQEFQDSMLDGHDLITGVLEMYEYGATVEIALKLHPSARQVIVITERKSTILAYLDELTSVMSQFDREVKLVVFSLGRLTMAELLEEIGNLGDESIVLLASAFRDREGQLYSLEESAAMIEERCAAPIYVTGFRWLGLGPVGGKLTNGFYQGQVAAKMAIRILKGESVRNIPIMRESPNAYMFDYIQLKHFGISLSDLPQGSVVINEPESFYYQYKTWLWGVTAIVAGLVVVVMILSANILRRRKAEEALIQSEEKYRSVVENIGIGISVINPNMEILTVNKQIKQWFPNINVSKKPICHKVFNNPPRDDICSYCPTYKTLKDGQVHESITETPAGDKIVNYRIVSSPIKDKDDKVVAAIEMVEEITERKKAEKALRESEERYKALFQGAAEGIIVADIETMEFKYANPAVCRMLGYTEEELKRMGVRDIHPKEDLEHVVSEFESQARGEKTLSLGIPCLRKDGTTMYADIDTAKVLIDGRECNVGFFTDITERKKAEEELYEAEAKYRTLVEQIPAVTYIAALDKASTTLYISPQIETLIGFSREEYEKDPDIWRERLHPDDRGRVMAEVERSHKSSEPFCCEYRMLTRDDHVVWFRDEAVVVRSSKNKPLFLQGVMFDITERKLSEKALQKVRDELEIRVKQRTADLARVNEELRNEISERKKAKEKLQSLASELSLAEERLRRRIATDIHDHIGQNLAISKIKLESLAESMSSSKLAKSLGEIRDVIAEIIESTRSLTFELSPPVLYELGFEAAVEWLVRQAREQHGLSTKFKGDGKAKPLDNDVRVLLFQAVRELLVNIAKHAQARNVTVSTRRVGDEIRVNVEDDGVGFDISRVGSRDYKKGGFGLFSIRERLGLICGHLDVESKPGHGTRVTLVAPINHKDKSSKE